MYRFLKRGAGKKAGLPPGTMVHVGEDRQESVTVDIIDYTPDNVRECMLEDPADIAAFRQSESTTWINMNGLSDISLLKGLAEQFEIHSLTMEDILNTGHRPKTEDFSSYNFTVLKMLSIDEKGDLDVEQVSLILGATFVISFQERLGDVFDAVRDRIRDHQGRIRTMGADYLAYSLMDAITDHYFIVLEHTGDELEDIEQMLLNEPHPGILSRIHHCKRKLFFLRKSVWPLREVVNQFARDESPFLGESSKFFFRDLYDHTVHVIDTIETFRDVASGVMDLHVSITGNRMNEVMKVLTIIATIFIPITFIAGIYGMNFNTQSPWNMPELNWRYGYLAVWVVMLLVVCGMIAYFRRKRWL